jgi:hypothetical protein
MVYWFDSSLLLVPRATRAAQRAGQAHCWFGLPGCRAWAAAGACGPTCAFDGPSLASVFVAGPCWDRRRGQEVQEVQQARQVRQVRQAVGWADQEQGVGLRVEVGVEAEAEAEAEGVVQAETVKRVEGVEEEWRRREGT